MLDRAEGRMCRTSPAIEHVPGVRRPQRGHDRAGDDGGVIQRGPSPLRQPPSQHPRNSRSRPRMSGGTRQEGEVALVRRIVSYDVSQHLGGPVVPSQSCRG